MTDHAPDYKALLILYMAHVMDRCGESYLDRQTHDFKLSEYALKQLKEVEEWAAALGQVEHRIEITDAAKAGPGN